MALRVNMAAPQLGKAQAEISTRPRTAPRTRTPEVVGKGTAGQGGAMPTGLVGQGLGEAVPQPHAAGEDKSVAGPRLLVARAAEAGDRGRKVPEGGQAVVVVEVGEVVVVAVAADET